MHDLFIHVHAVLRPEVVLSKLETVIGGNDERRVLPQIVLVEVVQQLPEQEIAQRYDAVIVGA